MAIYMKKYQNQVRDSKMFGKWYWRAVSLRTLTTRQLAEEISQINTVTLPDVVAVLYSLGDILNKKLTSGYTVKLDGLGTFRTSVSSKSAEEKDKLIASKASIKSCRIIFCPEKTRDASTGNFINRLLAGATYADAAELTEVKTKPQPQP